MPEQIPPELIDRIKQTLEALTSSDCRVDDIYASEQREIVEPEEPSSGNGGSPPRSTPMPTGVRRFSLYVRYVVIAEEKAFKDHQKEEA
ncbi:hypothetical protein LCGC14_2533260 [marine sediment metagenome]|uniref:Uncharacterized protein n=1 Tax=marine sediment metagenome TaxID=412755 RepID=A0A0F9D4D7_9ZZZZ